MGAAVPVGVEDDHLQRSRTAGIALQHLIKLHRIHPGLVERQEDLRVDCEGVQPCV